MMMAEHPELSAQERAGKAFPVSWDQFHRDCRALTWRLNEVGPFHAVIAITRGGLVPAAIVARELRVRIIDNVFIAHYGQYKHGDLQGLKGLLPHTPQHRDRTRKGMLILPALRPNPLAASGAREREPIPCPCKTASRHPAISSRRRIADCSPAIAALSTIPQPKP